MTNTNQAAAAVKNAIELYATSLGVTVSEAVALYRKNESTRECVALLVLAQANPDKLRAMAKTLAA